MGLDYHPPKPTHRALCRVPQITRRVPHVSFFETWVLAP